MQVWTSQDSRCRQVRGLESPLQQSETNKQIASQYSGAVLLCDQKCVGASDWLSMSLMREHTVQQDDGRPSQKDNSNPRLCLGARQERILWESKLNESLSTRG